MDENDFLELYPEGQFNWSPEEAVRELGKVVRWCKDYDEMGAEIAISAVLMAAEIISADTQPETLRSIIGHSHYMAWAVGDWGSGHEDVVKAAEAFTKGAGSGLRTLLGIDAGATDAPMEEPQEPQTLGLHCFLESQ